MPKVIPGQRKRWPRKDKVIECRLAHPTWSTYKIARHVGCSPSTAWGAIKSAGLRCAKNKFSRKLQDHELQSVADLYAEGIKCVAIAVEYGIMECTVRGIARRRGHPPRDTASKRRRIIFSMYKEGEVTRVIAAKVGLTARHIRRIARGAGIPGRDPRIKLQEHERQAVVDLYTAGEKLKNIAIDYGITPSYAARLARERGVPGRNKRHNPFAISTDNYYAVVRPGPERNL